MEWITRYHGDTRIQKRQQVINICRREWQTKLKACLLLHSGLPDSGCCITLPHQMHSPSDLFSLRLSGQHCPHARCCDRLYAPVLDRFPELPQPLSGGELKKKKQKCGYTLTAKSVVIFNFHVWAACNSSKWCLLFGYPHSTDLLPVSILVQAANVPAMMFVFCLTHSNFSHNNAMSAFIIICYSPCSHYIWQ